jgi:hypothetical protein
MIPPRTNELQAGCGLNLTQSQELVDWATDAIVFGCDSKSLRILAGLQSPFDQDEVKRLFDASLKELGAEKLPTQLCLPIYIALILNEVLNNKLSKNEALRRLSNLCIQLNYDRQLMDFYLLYNAKSDLESETEQWYWPGANRSNIDEIINEYARQWLSDHEAKLHRELRNG